MSDRHTLQESIQQAQDEIQVKAAVSENDRSSHKSRSPVARISLSVVVLVLIGVKLLVTDGKARQIEQDLQESAVDLFLESDASVLYYYSRYMELPPQLPAEALQSFVNYQRGEGSEYTLSVNYSPYDRQVPRDATDINLPENVEELLIP